MQTRGIEVKSEAALNDVLTVLKVIFTPINSIVFLSLIGNTFGKVKDKAIGTDAAGRRIIVLLIVFLLVVIFESSYIGNFIHNLL